MADDIFAELRAPGIDKAKTLPRAMWCAALRHNGHERAAEEIESRDVNVKRLVRSAVQKADATIGTTTTSGFGAELMQTAVADYFEVISPLSAAARLISMGAKFPAPISSTFFPVAASLPTAVGWRGEGAAVAVWAGDLAQNILGPSKTLEVATVISKELVKRSNGYQVFERMLAEKMAATLDAVLFSAAAGDDTVNAGLLHGLTPITPRAIPDDAIASCLAELANLGGSGAAVLVVSPLDAGVIATRLPNLKVPVLTTRALASGRLVCLDPLAFASAISEQPIFDISEQATIHMSSAPLPIVAASGTVADPTRSTWQTATVAIRAHLDVAFVQRGALITYMDAAAWEWM